jgi:aquaporin NIP
MFGGPITGASMNPARSLGPAVASADFTSIWVYLTAPFLGAAIAAVTYQLLRGEDTTVPVPLADPDMTSEAA